MDQTPAPLTHDGGSEPIARSGDATDLGPSGWWRRVAASCVDFASLFLVAAAVASLLVAGLVLSGAVDRHEDSGQTALGLVVLGVWLVLGVAWFVVNWVVLQGRTGATIGKRMLGLRVVAEGDGEPIGPARSFVRQLAHLLDSVPFGLPYLLPLVDRPKRRTLADMVCGTSVQRTRRKAGTSAVVVSTVAAVVVAAVSALVVVAPALQTSGGDDSTSVAATSSTADPSDDATQDPSDALRQLLGPVVKTTAETFYADAYAEYKAAVAADPGFGKAPFSVQKVTAKMPDTVADLDQPTFKNTKLMAFFMILTGAYMQKFHDQYHALPAVTHPDKITIEDTKNAAVYQGAYQYFDAGQGDQVDLVLTSHDGGVGWAVSGVGVDEDYFGLDQPIADYFE